MSKKRIKIMIQGPNRRTYFRKGPIALHVSENQELENYDSTIYTDDDSIRNHVNRRADSAAHQQATE